MEDGDILGSSWYLYGDIFGVWFGVVRGSNYYGGGKFVGYFDGDVFEVGDRVGVGVYDFGEIGFE